MADPVATGSPGSTPSSLVRRLRQRQPQAWQRFLQVYGPLIYSWCRRRWGLDPAAAADVLQDVVVRVLEALPDFRGGNFVAWLAALTRSQAVNYLQRNPTRGAGGSSAQERLNTLPDVSDPAGEDEGPERVTVEDLGGVVRRALDVVRATAAEKSWQAFWQVTVEGRAPADVAADLGMSVNAVYIARSRVLSRLREAFGVLEEGPSTCTGRS
jgi:RNA polymerase sigma-70 factor (ECF subfamily)